MQKTSLTTALKTAEELYERGLTSQAILSLRKQTIIDPSQFLIYYNIGLLYLKNNKFFESLFNLCFAIILEPYHKDTRLCYLYSMLRIPRSQSLYLNAKITMVLFPDSDDITNLFSETLENLNLFDHAERYFKRTSLINCENKRHLWRWGLSLLKSGRKHDALQVFIPLLRDNLLNEEQLLQTGIAFYNCGLLTQAIDFFDLTSRINPNSAEAMWYKMTSLLPQISESSENLDYMRQAYSQALDKIIESFHEKPVLWLGLHKNNLPLPYYLPYQGKNDRLLQEKFGYILSNIMDNHPKNQKNSYFIHNPKQNKKHRLGIVSSYFRLHSNWKVPIKGWLDIIDREKFEVFLYYTHDVIDDFTIKAQNSCDHFYSGLTDIEDCIDRILADKLDCILYPEIGMHSLTGLLAAMRLAPMQCSSWGHPVTSGLPTIDYFLSAELMETAISDDHYTEKLIKLPHLSLYYDPDHFKDIDKVSREDFGFLADDILYWCCQNLSKYLPNDDDLFPKISLRNRHAKFIFIEHSGKDEGHNVFRRRMMNCFSAYELDYEQHCIFLPPQTQSRFLGLTKIMDLFLDTIGWSGCNSVLDAIEMNLPIITLPGELMRSRHAYAILTRIGMTETIASDKDSYINLAVELGLNKKIRQNLRQKIRQKKQIIYRDSSMIESLNSYFEKMIDRVI